MLVNHKLLNFNDRHYEFAGERWLDQISIKLKYFLKQILNHHRLTLVREL